MKRNLIITIQVSFETDLPLPELDKRVAALVRDQLPRIEGATPVGNYLVSIKPGPQFNFPSSRLGDDDYEVDKRRNIEADVGKEFDND